MGCLILLILCREVLGNIYDPMYVHKVPLVDTRCSHSVQPGPRFFPTHSGDATYEEDNTMHWYQSKQYDDGCPMEESDNEMEDMDVDDSLPPPPPPQFTSTPKPGPRPTTNRSNRRSTMSDPQPSTSRSANTSSSRMSSNTKSSKSKTSNNRNTSSGRQSSGLFGTSNNENRSVARLEPYQQDLSNYIPIGLDVGVPKMGLVHDL